VKLITILSLISLSASAQPDFNKVADAIWRVEGGSSTHYPYGIKSVATSNPRRVCLNTIRNNYARWQKAGSHGEFLDYLADRYCPASCDCIGNRNWHHNIHALLP
jgi:hypothetical protein